MGLADKLTALAARVDVSPVCTVGVILASLEEEDSKALQSALTSQASTRGIHEALKSEGFKIDRQTVSLHRKGFCRCKEAE